MIGNIMLQTKYWCKRTRLELGIEDLWPRGSPPRVLYPAVQPIDLATSWQTSAPCSCTYKLTGNRFGCTVHWIQSVDNWTLLGTHIKPKHFCSETTRGVFSAKYLPRLPSGYMQMKGVTTFACKKGRRKKNWRPIPLALSELLT